MVAGLSAAGGIVGGGMAAGPAIVAGAPAILGAKVINRFAFREKEGTSPTDQAGLKKNRRMTNIGAGIGFVSATIISLHRGLSPARIKSSVTSVGALVKGGTIVGVGILATLPIITAGIAAAIAYSGNRERLTTPSSSETQAPKV